MTLVRMLRSWRVWNPGETAGFDEHVAEELVRLGVAELVTPEAPRRGRK
jgi:hypothetical protein